MRKRLVLFVEGEGDRAAAPALVKKTLSNMSDMNAWDVVQLDDSPLKVGEIPALARKRHEKWRRLLHAARKRKGFGGVLLLLDGDAEKLGGRAFCPVEAARQCARAAAEEGAGVVFSVACVLARQEYESWLIAGIESLAGRELPDGRQGVRPGVIPPGPDLEQSPRDAKGWLSRQMISGYKPTTDQLPLTRMVDWALVRDRPMRSFQRLESAVRQLAEAFREDRHIATPE